MRHVRAALVRLPAPRWCCAQRSLLLPLHHPRPLPWRWLRKEPTVLEAAYVAAWSAVSPPQAVWVGHLDCSAVADWPHQQAFFRSARRPLRRPVVRAFRRCSSLRCKHGDTGRTRERSEIRNTSSVYSSHTETKRSSAHHTKILHTKTAIRSIIIHERHHHKNLGRLRAAPGPAAADRSFGLT